MKSLILKLLQICNINNKYCDKKKKNLKYDYLSISYFIFLSYFTISNIIIYHNVTLMLQTFLKITTLTVVSFKNFIIYL